MYGVDKSYCPTALASIGYSLFKLLSYAGEFKVQYELIMLEDLNHSPVIFLFVVASCCDSDDHCHG